MKVLNEWLIVAGALVLIIGGLLCSGRAETNKGTNDKMHYM